MHGAHLVWNHVPFIQGPLGPPVRRWISALIGLVARVLAWSGKSDAATVLSHCGAPVSLEKSNRNVLGSGSNAYRFAAGVSALCRRPRVAQRTCKNLGTLAGGQEWFDDHPIVDLRSHTLAPNRKLGPAHGGAQRVLARESPALGLFGVASCASGNRCHFGLSTEGTVRVER